MNENADGITENAILNQLGKLGGMLIPAEFARAFAPSGSEQTKGEGELAEGGYGNSAATGRALNGG